MKKLAYLIAAVAISLTVGCQPGSKADNEKNIIHVGVFDKNGDSPDCITDALEALRIDSGIEARTISAADIISGAADDIDVFLFPGGSGRSETGSLGLLGQQKIIDKVKKNGKGVVGICAGAYILSETPGYPSLGLSAAQAIDIEHDHRGHGLVKFSLTEEGKKIFPELKDSAIYYSLYYEGPVLTPAKDSKYHYTELATMQSDVHTVAGTPANMTNNRPFIIIINVEKGKTASVVGHPEATQGMRWMIPRLVRVVANRELVSYKSNVVRPYIHTKEIVFTDELLAKQDEDFGMLIKSTEEKLTAMQQIVDMRAWSAKKYIPQMVRDTSFEVRYLAAKLIVELERTNAIPDLQAAANIEKDIKKKKLLQKELILLKEMVGAVK
jgi:putative intracellular protease/amidase